jgi:hypothetical protein
MHTISASVGVRRAAGNRWSAQIKVQRLTAYLGTHDTEEGAQTAYAAAWFIREAYLAGCVAWQKHNERPVCANLLGSKFLGGVGVN